MRPAEASAGRVKESYWPEQVEATIFTVSTLRVGELAADAVGFCSLIDGCCTVPVISTLCPTCALSFASLASSLYSLAIDVADVADPDVPVAPEVLGLSAAFVRMNFASGVVAGVLVDPLVPVGD